jgi:hypothetical protein
MSTSNSNGNVGSTSDVKKRAVAGFTAAYTRGCEVCGAYGQWKHTDECPNREVPVQGVRLESFPTPVVEPRWDANECNVCSAPNCEDPAHDYRFVAVPESVESSTVRDAVAAKVETPRDTSAVAKDGSTLAERRAKYLASQPKTYTNRTLKIENMGKVVKKPIKWLWDKFVPLGKLTIFCGDPGNMKSLASGDLAARGSTGANMPDDSPGQRFDSLMMVGEDDIDDTTVPRLEAAGADVQHITAIHGYTATDTLGNIEEGEIALDEHIHLIREYLNTHPNVKLVVIDPLSNYLGKASMVDEKEIRARILVPLKKLAAETGVAVLGIMHLNKKVSLGAINRVGGAMGFVGVARMVWMFLRDQEDNDRLYMLQVKANITKNTKGLAFQAVEKGIDIGGETVGQPVIQWMGAAAQSVNQHLSGAAEGDSKPAHRPKSKNGTPSAQWLRNLMSDGIERPLKDVLKAARLDKGYGRSTIFLARESTPIVAVERKGDGGKMVTYWRMGVSTEEVGF